MIILKHANLTIKIILATFISILTAILIYGILVPLLTGYDKIQTLNFIKRLAINAVTLGPLSTWAVYLIYKPAGAVINKIERDIDFAEEELAKGIKAVERVPSFLFIIGSLSYLVGVVFNYMPLYLKGISFNMTDFYLRLVIAVMWGLINGIITGRILNCFLIEAKMCFKIYTLDQFRTRKTSIIARLIIPISLLILFAFTANVISFITYSRKAENFTIVERIMGINLFMFIVIVIIAYIIILESMSYIRNLSLQLNEMFQDNLNLTSKIAITIFDDVGAITGKINSITDRLTKTFRNIKELALNVSESGKKTNSTISDSYSRAVEIEKNIVLTENEVNNQINSIENMVSHFNEVINFTQNFIEQSNSQSLKIITTSDSLKEMISSFDGVLNLTANLESEFKKMMTLFETSGNGIKLASNSISQIAETGNKVQNIVNIISDIADKTNLLSMNASIEAAHAGEQGKGFSVVASEIRKLSLNTANSAKIISGLINEISDKIENGKDIFHELTKTFSQLSSKSDDITAKINEISSRSSTHIGLVKNNLTKIDDLLESSKKMKEKSITHYHTVEKLQSSIDKISEDTRKISDSETIMIEKIKEVVTSYDEIQKSSEKSFNDIKKLEIMIEKYKID